MDLLERCRSFRHELEGHESLRRAHKQAEGFRGRASDLELVLHDLSSAMSRMGVLRSRGIILQRYPDASKALMALQEYETGISDPSKESGKDYGRLKRSLDRVAREAVVAVEAAIQGIKQDLPTIEEAFLKQVELIPAYVEQVGRIRRERDGLLAGTEPEMMSPAELSSFLDRREELRTLADQLRPIEFPKEVLDFFKSARQSGGAPFEKLTEPVRLWLKERDLLKNLRLVVAR